MLSCIVPVYNVELYLKECVDSILNQSDKDIEVILIDDGSTDGGGAICDDYARFDSRVKVVHKENGGLSSARNVGIDMAKGEYIWFIDSDDSIMEDSIEKLIQCIVENSNPDIIFFESDMHEDNEEKENVIGTYHRERQYYGENATLLVKELMDNHEYFPMAVTYIFNKSFLDVIGLRFVAGILHEDNPFTLCLFVKASRIVHVHEPLYKIRIRQGSITRKKVTISNFQGVIKGIKYIYEKNRHINCEAKRLVCYREQLAMVRKLIQWIDGNEIYRGWYNDAQMLFEKKLLYSFNYLYEKKLVIYGYGSRGKKIVNSLPSLKYVDIWDKDYNGDANVNKPDFSVLNDEYALVICIDDFSVFEEIRTKCLEFGFYNVIRWEELYVKQKCKEKSG